MAINPNLVSIIPASELPTGVPTSAGQFFFYEGNEMKKSPMTEIYELVSNSKSIGTITPSSTIPTEGNVWGFAGEGTYPNAGNITVAAGKFAILSRVGTTWSKVEVEPNVPNGKVEEGNTQAVSGGEVYSKIKPITQSVKNLNDLVTGEIDITPSSWINGYVTTSGVFTSNSSYRISDFIPVSKFEEYVVSLSGSPSTLLVSAYSTNSQESFLSGSPLNIIGSEQSLQPRIININIPNGVNFIRLGFHSYTPIKDIYAHKVLNTSIVKSLDNISGDINGKIITSTTVWSQEYVNSTGILNSSNSYRLSPFIPVELGDSYLAGLSGSEATLMVSAYTDSNQSSFINGSALNIKGYETSTDIKHIKFSITEENVKYIRVGCYSGNENDAYLKKTGLENRVKALETKTNGFNVKYFSTIKKEIFSRRKPVFSFIFDDLNDTDELVYNIFKEFDFNVGFALQSSKISSLNISIYQEMYMNGTTILSHGVTSVNDETSMKNSKIALKNNDFVVSGWVTNSSELPVALLPTVKKYYGYAFTSAPPNKGVLPSATDFNETKDPCELKRVGLETWNKDEIKQAALKSLIDYAIDNNLLITFYGHKMSSTYLNTDGTTSVFTEDDLRGVLSYLQEKQENGLCEVLSPDEAIYQYYKGIIL